MNDEETRWLAEAKRRVDAALSAFLDEKQREASAVDPEADALAAEVKGLTLRAGKRLRGGLVILGHELAGGTGPEPILPAAVAFELLQTHLLIQDDWMDRDDLRRGGPSVHRALAARLHDEHKGASLAILASDLAWAWAVEVLLRAEVSAERRLAALVSFAQVETEVVYGQLLDVLGASEVEKVHQLKTAGYTVCGPLRLGAILGGGSSALFTAIERFAIPLGIAFQLRDDLLGTFGTPSQTGKAVGADLKAGKRTMIVALAERLLSAEARELLELVLGNGAAPNEDVAQLTALLEESGVRARVEAKAASLEAESRAAVDDLVRLAGPGAEKLRVLVTSMAGRVS